jgi:NADH-quinone oxidoreductase subunit A
MIYLFQYYSLLIFVLFSSILTFLLVIISYTFSLNTYNFEKNTSYECGFEPFGDAKYLFNPQYYIVSILFLIFDLEIALLIPWSVALGRLGIFSF